MTRYRERRASGTWLNALRHGLRAVSYYEPGADLEIEALADASCWCRTQLLALGRRRVRTLGLRHVRSVRMSLPLLRRVFRISEQMHGEWFAAPGATRPFR